MEEQETSKVETIVKVSILVWSAALLTLSYWEPPSGKKIVDFVKLEVSTRLFVDNDAMDNWFNEQSV